MDAAFETPEKKPRIGEVLAGDSGSEEENGQHDAEEAVNPEDEGGGLTPPQEVDAEDEGGGLTLRVMVGRSHVCQFGHILT